MKVSAVVVTYNRKALLEECLAKIEAQVASCELSVFVIDNASTDGTAQMVAGLGYDNIVYVNTGSNLGGAGGFSFGVKAAVEAGCDYLWIMDDDCMPEPGALAAFVDYVDSHPGFKGFLSSKVLWRDGSISKMNVQRERVFHNVADFDSPEVRVDLASFVSLFVPAETVRELGLPIADFYIWTDDWEFTRRISRAYPSYLLNGSVVVHKSASNTGATIYDTDEDRLDRFNYLYRNDVVLYRREGLKGFGYEAARLALHTVNILRKAPGSKGRRLATMYSATFKGLSYRPEIQFPEAGE
jgi:GT2 family glycosyltransferase